MVQVVYLFYQNQVKHKHVFHLKKKQQQIDFSESEDVDIPLDENIIG